MESKEIYCESIVSSRQFCGPHALTCAEIFVSVNKNWYVDRDTIRCCNAEVSGTCDLWSVVVRRKEEEENEDPCAHAHAERL